MVDGAQALADISGLPKEEVLSLWEQVKENNRKLKGCNQHKFIIEGVPLLGSKQRCVNCGGDMGLVAIGEYVRGYEAAGGDTNDIWPG